MNRTVDFLKYFAPFSLVLFLIQFFIMQSLSEKIVFFYPAWSIYLFNVITTFLIYLLLTYINKNFSTYTGFTFLGLSFFKMMLAVVFLIPFIKSHIADPLIDVASFFIPYFLFLVFETYFAIRLINRG